MTKYCPIIIIALLFLNINCDENEDALQNPFLGNWSATETMENTNQFLNIVDTTLHFNIVFSKNMKAKINVKRGNIIQSDDFYNYNFTDSEITLSQKQGEVTLEKTFKIKTISTEEMFLADSIDLTNSIVWKLYKI